METTGTTRTKACRVACVPCRQRHRRCDGLTPCFQCNQRKEDCYYPAKDHLKNPAPVISGSRKRSPECLDSSAEMGYASSAIPDQGYVRKVIEPLHKFLLGRQNEHHNFIMWDIASEDIDEVLAMNLKKVYQGEQIVNTIEREYQFNAFIFCNAIALGLRESKDPDSVKYANTAYNLISKMILQEDLFHYDVAEKLTILDHLFLLILYWITQLDLSKARFLTFQAKNIMESIDRNLSPIPTFLEIRMSALLIWSCSNPTDKRNWLNYILSGDTLQRVEADTLVITGIMIICDSTVYTDIQAGNLKFIRPFTRNDPYAKNLITFIQAIADVMTHSCSSRTLRALFFLCRAILRYRCSQVLSQPFVDDMNRTLQCLYPSPEGSLGFWITGLALSIGVGAEVKDVSKHLSHLLNLWPDYYKLWTKSIQVKINQLAVDNLPIVNSPILQNIEPNVDVKVNALTPSSPLDVHIAELLESEMTRYEF